MTGAVAYRLLAPRAVLLGPSNPSSLANVIPTPLEDGALCWVVAEESLYYLAKFSEAAVSPPNVIATALGAGVPGRWILYAAGGGGGPAGADGAIQYNNGGFFGGTTFTTDGESISGIRNINGLRQPTYAPVLLGDEDATILASDGSFFDIYGPLTDNIFITVGTGDSPRLGIVLAIRRFDHSAFTVTIQQEDDQPLWVFATAETGECDVIFTGDDYTLAGVRLSQEPP